MQSKYNNYIARDISWLYFNARVLQEASDANVSLANRIRFLGIFSNNLDEFFRVRVAALKRIIEFSAKNKNNLQVKHTEKILQEIQTIVIEQQNEFNRIWEQLVKELKHEKIFLPTNTQLNTEQKKFVANYFEEEVRANIIPLMVESIPNFPYLKDRSIYLAVVMHSKQSAYKRKYALIEVPVKQNGRFKLLPSKAGSHSIILLEDVIRYNLPKIFSYLEYDNFSAHIIKVTKDAELDIDQELSSSFVTKVTKAVKKRRSGKPVRFIYDKEIDAGLLDFLMRKINLGIYDNLIPGGRVHNFKHFMNFPKEVFNKTNLGLPIKNFTHPLLVNVNRVTDVVLKRDVLLHFPYHKFDSLIDMLREAAIDPLVFDIKICCYRLAQNSKIINALINAVRNGKKVTVVLELRARFDEEANIVWKTKLEEEGVQVLVGFANTKVHAKICLISRKHNSKITSYGFVGTGNMNEQTAKVYSDIVLFTANKLVTADIAKIFKYIQFAKQHPNLLNQCKTLWVSPVSMRQNLKKYINHEIKNFTKGLPAFIYLKLNAITDFEIIDLLQHALKLGVDVKLIVRGIYSAPKKDKFNNYCLSIVDEFLEHSRLYIFGNNNNPKAFISSADVMRRNLDYRIEAACPIFLPQQIERVIKIFNIQFKDNVKARWLNSKNLNQYTNQHLKKKTRSQVEIYNYLQQIKNNM
jgi:polyphosphate kinase